MSPVDLRNYSVEALRQLRSRIEAEIGRRTAVVDLPAQMDQLAQQYLTTQGVDPGDEWSQPQGSLGAYPKGWELTHDDKHWVSLVSGNVWEPGVSGWREVSAPGEAPKAWLAPTGAHDTYQAQERVTHNDSVWTSLIDHNVWEPGEFGWREERGPEDAEDAWTTGTAYAFEYLVAHEGSTWRSVIEGNLNEPGASETWIPALPLWSQPQGAHDAYGTGAEVYHGGQNWASLHSANVWVPPTQWDALTVPPWELEEPTDPEPEPDPELEPEDPEEPVEPEPEPDPDPEPEPDPDPDPEPEPDPDPEPEPEGYPAWKQPQGGHDAYAMGARVSHAGQDWESTANGNVWEPGAYGWKVV